MIIHKGLCVVVCCDGVDSLLTQDHTDITYLTVTAPSYSPYGVLPDDSDKGLFAQVFRHLNGLVQQGKLQGPFGTENHPLVSRQFNWLYSGSFLSLLRLLTDNGIQVTVREISHRGDEAEVNEVVRTLSPWINRDTIVMPNPQVEELRKKREDEEFWNDCEAKAERQDFILRRCIYPILLFLLVCLAVCAFTAHWWIALATLFTIILIVTGLIYWILRNS